MYKNEDYELILLPRRILMMECCLLFKGVYSDSRLGVNLNPPAPPEEFIDGSVLKAKKFDIADWFLVKRAGIPKLDERELPECFTSMSKFSSSLSYPFWYIHTSWCSKVNKLSQSFSEEYL